MAAEKIRMERTQNEEQIRMNRTSSLFEAISKRQKWHEYSTNRTVNMCDKITQELERIGMAVAMEKRNHSTEFW